MYYHDYMVGIENYLEKISSHCEDQNSIITELEYQLQSKTDIIDKLEDEIDSLKSENEDLESEKGELEDEFFDLETEIIHLEEELQDAVDEIRLLKEKLNPNNNQNNLIKKLKQTYLENFIPTNSRMIISTLKGNNRYIFVKDVTQYHINISEIQAIVSGFVGLELFMDLYIIDIKSQMRFQEFMENKNRQLIDLVRE